jgi:hypothetical protein
MSTASKYRDRETFWRRRDEEYDAAGRDEPTEAPNRDDLAETEEVVPVRLDDVDTAWAATVTEHR